MEYKTQGNTYVMDVLNAKTLVLGQLELYKIKYSESDDNNYLKIMNQLNETYETIIKMDECIQRISKELKQLKE